MPKFETNPDSVHLPDNFIGIKAIHALFQFMMLVNDNIFASAWKDILINSECEYKQSNFYMNRQNATEKFDKIKQNFDFDNVTKANMMNNILFLLESAKSNSASNFFKSVIGITPEHAFCKALCATVKHHASQTAKQNSQGNFKNLAYIVQFIADHYHDNPNEFKDIFIKYGKHTDYKENFEEYQSPKETNLP